jgi:hypothetical protein
MNDNGRLVEAQYDEQKAHHFSRDARGALHSLSEREERIPLAYKLPTVHAQRIIGQVGRQRSPGSRENV